VSLQKFLPIELSRKKKAQHGSSKLAGGDSKYLYLVLSVQDMDCTGVAVRRTRKETLANLSDFYGRDALAGP